MRISKGKFAVLVAFSIVGLITSAFVLWTWNIERHTLPACTSSQTLFGLAINCARVLGSQYSTVFGVPLEVFAVAYFIVNLLLVWIYAFATESRSTQAFRLLFFWRFLGLALVPYLVFVEVVLLHAICVYCTTMHVMILADFAVVSWLLFRSR
jgi:uncharacterized membrane protein